MTDAQPGLPLVDAVTSLTREYSLEVTPKEVLKRPGELAEQLTAGTRVYITFLANGRFEDTVAAARSVRSQGMRPVPHLAARNVSDEAELDRMIGALAGAGVEELLVIGGSLKQPAGAVHESMQVLRSGVLERHGIGRVGVAGHPEGNSDIGDEALARTLAEKNAFAAATGIELYLLTQFCFAAEPIVAWERSIRAAGNRLPVHVGLPGLTSPASLIKFGLACGVGPSLKVLRKQSGGVLKLATTNVYYPDQTLLELGRSLTLDPVSLIRQVHFFPFGAVRATAGWVSDVGAGRFDIDGANGRLSIAGASA